MCVYVHVCVCTHGGHSRGGCRRLLEFLTTQHNFPHPFSDKSSSLFLWKTISASNSVVFMGLVFLFFCFLAVLHGLRDVSSPTRD